MFQILTIAGLVLLAIVAPGTALIALPIAWIMFDRLRKRHRENKRVLAIFLEHQREDARLKAARAWR